MRDYKMYGLFDRAILKDGNGVIISMAGASIPSTLWVNPVAGDTVNLWVSFDNGGNWLQWDNGPVTTLSALTLSSGCTHIKAQRTVGTGVTSTFGVC